MKLTIKTEGYDALHLPAEKKNLVLALCQSGVIRSSNDLYLFLEEEDITPECPIGEPVEVLAKNNMGEATMELISSDGEYLWTNAAYPHRQPVGAILIWEVAYDKTGGGMWERQFFPDRTSARRAYEAIRAEAGIPEETIDDHLCLNLHHIPTFPADLADYLTYSL